MRLLTIIVGISRKREGISRAHYEPTETIFREGGLARNLYIISSGKVQVFRQQGVEEKTEATLGPGEFFGERSLMRGGRHTASARAVTPVDLLIMNGMDFASFATSSTRFGELLQDVLQERSSGGDVDKSAGDTVPR